MFTFDLNHIPFSLPGSFLTLSTRNQSGTHRLLYRTCSARAVTRSTDAFPASDFFEIALTRNGVEIPYTCNAQPHRLDLTVEDGSSATFAFNDPQTILFTTNNVLLRLIPCKTFPVLHSANPGHIMLVDPSARGVHNIRAYHSIGIVTKPTDTIKPRQSTTQGTAYTIDFLRNSGALSFTVDERPWNNLLPLLPEVIEHRQKQFNKWMEHLPRVPEKYLDAARQAWFLLWVSQVPASGALTRPAIYMSKFWMNAIWSWDNCFNALAIAEANPELAWDQIHLFYDHQTESGQIPDMITDLEPMYAYTKPPIHGWAIQKLITLLGEKKSMPHIKQLYKPLEAFTEWWYTLRDTDHDGMCEYHHGNDGGWDNATVYDQGFPTEGADLAAHLVLQMEQLAAMSKMLGRNKISLRWLKRSQKQLAALLAQCVRDGKFISPLSSRERAEPSQSLINYIPVELGSRLPEDLRTSLLADLQPGGIFLTEYGLATESPFSPKYQPDGYWRGPIWAPSTYLIVDGLIHAGELQLARTIAERFCDLNLKSPGFWENYDALTGTGLRCPGYTWTASVFLLLAHWLAQNEPPS